MLLALLFALCAGTALARPQAAQAATSYARTIRDGRAAAQALLAQSGAASLSLAFVSGDRVVWQETFGYADTATSTPPAADTMYGIGSVSKMLATVATMQLVDQGKVDLDAPFRRYVPSFTMASPAYRQITVRMLIDHSSGFPGSTYTNWMTGVYYPGYLQQVMDTLAGEQLKTTPGYMSVYCNDGFTMVEALVAAVTGESYAQYVQEHILDPLGMTHSAYPLTTFADGTYARCYAGGKARPFEVVNLLASGGAVLHAHRPEPPRHDAHERRHVRRQAHPERGLDRRDGHQPDEGQLRPGAQPGVELRARLGLRHRARTVGRRRHRLAEGRGLGGLPRRLHGRAQGPAGRRRAGRGSARLRHARDARPAHPAARPRRPEDHQAPAEAAAGHGPAREDRERRPAGGDGGYWAGNSLVLRISAAASDAQASTSSGSQRTAGRR